MNTKNVGRAFVASLSASAFVLVGAANFAMAETPATGSSLINSGGAAGSSDGDHQSIPEVKELPLRIPNDRVIFEAPYGPADQVPINPRYALPVQTVASTAENNASLDNFTKITGAAVTGGSLVGTVGGAVVGCVVGGVILPAVGCIPGAVTGAGIGAVVGTVVAGGPAAIATGVDLAQTFMAEPGTTHWAAK